MRIAIDARLNAYRQGGIPQYTRQLMTALADVATDDQIISFQHRDQLRPLAIAPNVMRRTAITPPHHRFEQWALPLEVLLSRADVLHCPDFIAPTRRHCRAVVTIHDLAFMHYPEILDASARAYYSQVTSNAPRADAIIAVSEATRQDIAQFLDIPIEQIDVIHEAAAPLYTQIEMREGEARVLNSTPVAAGTFMLFVSTLEPRKNLPTLLQALRICLDRRPEAGYRLVIVGRRGWRDEAIFQAARDLKLADHVLFTGGVGQYDLRWLYNACRLYINPSLYEGFGLPLLEAMACGAPCLAAATSSLPEIGGSAAIYVPPLEAEQWADQIMALWDDEDRRAELGRLGLARAQQFSWTRAARETLKVYRRAVEGIVPRPEPAVSTRLGQALEQPGERYPLPSVDLTSLGSDSRRPCLRCGTALQPGDLQLGVHMRAFEADQEQDGRVPRMWACPRCGYVELVAEQHTPTHHGHAADSADSNGVPHPSIFDKESTPDHATPMGQLVAVELDAAAGAEDADTSPPVEPDVYETAPPGQLVAVELDAAAGAEDADTSPPVEPDVYETAPPGQLVAVELDAAAGAEDADTSPPAEPDVYATAVLSSVDAVAIAHDPEQIAPVAPEGEPVTSAEVSPPTLDLPALPSQEPGQFALVSELGAPAQEEPLQALELPALPSQEQDEPVLASELGAQGHDNLAENAGAQLGAIALPDTQAPAELAGTLPDAPTAAPNGSIPKIKSRSGRGSRRQSPAADAPASQAPKRRSSGSKRKQTP